MTVKVVLDRLIVRQLIRKREFHLFPGTECRHVVDPSIGVVENPSVVFVIPVDPHQGPDDRNGKGGGEAARESRSAGLREKMKLDSR